MNAGYKNVDAGSAPSAVGRGMLLLCIAWIKHQQRAYWYCQLSGWGLVGLYWSYYTDFAAEGWIAIPHLLVMVGWQIAATHLYARTARARAWTSLPLPQLLPIVVVAWVLLLAQYLLMSWMSYGVQCNCQGGFLNALPGALTGGARYLAIWLLAYHGYHLSRQGALHAAEAARQAQLATEAQLAKLTGELNPHFLFNALNSIKALTREDPVRARTAIDHLAALLRQSLRRGGAGDITLGEELELVQEYLALEQLRFEERLAVNWHLPAGCKAFTLPPLSVHTLVENAVKHGIARRPDGGSIAIAVRTDPRYWTVEVTNGGEYADGNQGSGLGNLRQRLHLRYGRQASVTLRQIDRVGYARVQATLKLPR